jgi:hypothetical protein
MFFPEVWIKGFWLYCTNICLGFKTWSWIWKHFLGIIIFSKCFWLCPLPLKGFLSYCLCMHRNNKDIWIITWFHGTNGSHSAPLVKVSHYLFIWLLIEWTIEKIVKLNTEIEILCKQREQGSIVSFLVWKGICSCKTVALIRFIFFAEVNKV